jgi:hypothetical protein
MRTQAPPPGLDELPGWLPTDQSGCRVFRRIANFAGWWGPRPAASAVKNAINLPEFEEIEFMKMRHDLCKSSPKQPSSGCTF